MAREGSLKLRFLPWRKGLATAGQQSSVPEDSMWQAQDVIAGLDGLLNKRPGLRQWGQALVQGTVNEPFLDSSLPGWIQANDNTSLLTLSAQSGQLRINAAAGSSNETLTLSYPGTVATDASVRFVVQAVNVQAMGASETNADTFHFRVAKDATTGWEFAIWSGGLYYKTVTSNEYTLVTGTANVGAGAWSVIEIRIDADGNCLVYLDDSLVDTIAASAMAEPSLTSSGAIMELAAEVDASNPYYVNLCMLSWTGSASSPFTAQTVTAVTDFRAVVGSGTLQNTLMCAAGNYIYHDAFLTGVWRPIERKTHDNVTFAPYRRKIAWVEHNGFTSSKVKTWSGSTTESTTELDNAPNCRFVAEHQTRMWAAGDRNNPLRVYYSGDRQENVWFSPPDNNISDRFDTQLKAGYLEVPSRRGDEITGIFGDYYGQLIVFTKQGVYRVSGSGPQSFAIQSVTQDVGCENVECITQVGNDIWFLSREGCHSLSATDKYGDVVAGFVSGPIQDLWGGDASAVSPINKTYIQNSRLRYNSTLGLVYVAVPQSTDTTAAKTFVFNVTTQEWYGPWQIDSQALDRVEIASPLVEVMMHGGSDGKTYYTDLLYKSDAGTAITSVIESPMLTGRSIDPALTGVEKTWKRLRIYLLPRGDWDLKVFWKVDSGFYQDADTLDPDQNKDQNVFDVHDLTDEFRIGEDPDGRLRSRESLGYIEVILDKRGYGLAFQIKQDGNGEDFAIQGYEVDFIPHGYSRE